tara:strand:+ start:1823 stop:2092 length:270 start_codon:yes stop_codon:yes gene_type:complete
MEVFCNICKKTKKIQDNLTFKETKVLEFIINFTKIEKKSPSMREIANGLGLKSLSSVDRYVYRLQDKQYIAKTPYTKRSIVVLKDIICA